MSEHVWVWGWSINSPSTHRGLRLGELTEFRADKSHTATVNGQAEPLHLGLYSSET